MVAGNECRSRGWLCGGLVVLALILALAFSPSPMGVVRAATVTVPDCMGSSLATAISTAGAGDTITFAQDCPTGAPITLTSTQTISKNLTIDGTGHRVVISGGNMVRLFTVNSGVIFAVTGLTLTGGNAVSGNGGGIYNNGGTVAVTNSTLTGNSASNNGGGILNNGGTATVTNSTLSGNSATNGGGIFNFATGTVTMTNSTLSGNFADIGGGIANFSMGTVTVTNSTLSGNSANIGGGGIYNSGTMNAANTLIVNSTSGGDVGGNGINGTNTQNRTGSFTFAGGLQDNGGPTQTLAIPTPATPTATDAYQGGDLATCNAIAASGTPAGVYDQRGANRVVGGTCSIGAYEPGLVTTTTTLSAVPASAAFGTPVTFTARISGVLGGTPPDGTNAVTFKNGGAMLSSANFTAGVATFTTGTLGPGNSVTATYTAGGAGNAYGASPASNAVSVTITPIACVVTSTMDPTEGGKLTLRDAVNVANAGACTGNTITFDAAVFSAATAKTITVGSTLSITGTVTIDGTGHQVTISGGNTVGLFTVSSGATFTVNSLTLTRGKAVGLGGAIYNTSGSTLTVTNSTLSGNFATNGGGAIFNTGGSTLTVTNSTLSGNSATNGSGGGIFNASGSTLTMTNSTLSGNAANTGIGIGIGGGGIYNNTGGTVTVTNSTLSGNFATSSGDGGGIFSNGTLNAANTLIVNNTSGGDLGGSGINGTNTKNLTGSFTFATPLQNNGGPTQTFALPPGSPALGGGDLATCTSTTTPAAAPVAGRDQRGLARPDPGTTACDIGAFESQGFMVAKTSGDAQSVIFGSTTAFAPLTATLMSNDGFVVNTGTLTFVIVPGTGNATFGAAGGTGCTVSIDLRTASGCTVNAMGVATSPPFTGTNVGGFTVTASASLGDAAGATYSETVTQALTTTSVTAMPATSTFGQAVTLTATLAVTAPGAGTPTGSVTFTLGSTTLGSGTVNGTGMATISTTALPAGVNQTITATYSGDANFTTSSGTTSVTVNPATIILTAPNGTGSGNSGSASAPTIRAGGSITLIANPNTGLTYTSRDPNIAAVDPTTGVVTGLAPGTVTITVTGPNGSSGSIVVTVTGGTGNGLVAPAPMAHAAGMASTAGAGATPVAQPTRKADGTGSTGGVQPQAAGATAAASATPQPAPARR